MRIAGLATMAWLLLVLTPGPLSATTQFVTEEVPGPTSSDRPTNGIAATLVPDGYVLLESGIAWQKAEFEEDDVTLTQIRSLVSSVRIGYRPWIELQLNYDGQYESDREFRDLGFTEESFAVGDFELATKLRLATVESHGINGALAFALNLPTGDDLVSTDRFDPRVTLALGRPLASWLSIDANAAAQTLGDDFSEAYTTLALSVSPTSRFTFIAEHTASFRLDETGEPAHLLLFAGVVTISDRLSVDLALGMGLSDEAFDSIGNVGVTWRIPE